MAYDSERLQGRLRKEPDFKRNSHLDMDRLIAEGLGEVAEGAPAEEFVPLWEQAGYQSPRKVEDGDVAVPALMKAANDRVLPQVPGEGIMPRHN